MTKRVYVRLPVAERFWPKVLCNLTTRCWIWRSAVSSTGYGVISGSGRSGAMLRASRISWEFAHGGHPCLRGPLATHISVCHRCDVLYATDDGTWRRCVNPAHLFLGTHADNMADMARKGRADRTNKARGERSANAKCTSAIITAIRSEHASGVAIRAIARKYNLGRNTVKCIIERSTWRHVS